MLDLNNVNKYFNKGKKNELHVINNTSLHLEKRGLIALLGPSGCGKTTLLNTIGGLDKIKSGSIYINGKKMSSKISYKVDKIRNLEIGYIFQDYKLIDNLSVYENVALVLTMIGIKDKNEIKKRVEYVLEKVGMLRYKKRPASMLSGGERQRVAIARAIVKDPAIILADEPTGNLDSKNSLEIMKIIKSISLDRLVILVTHEQKLAKFYASRIIEIKDGKIVNDYLNNHKNELDYEIDNRFYLKDFKNCKKIDKNVNVYSEDECDLNLDIVIKNGNIYIKSNDHNKVEVVDENSNIEFIFDNYKKIAKSDIDKYDFDFKNIIDNNFKKKYASILNPITLIINGFKKVFDFPLLKKILLVGFFLSAMFIMYAVSSISASFNIDESKFVKINKDYLSIIIKNINIDDYLNYEKSDNINYLIPGDSVVKFNVLYDDFYQTSKSYDIMTGSVSDINMISSDDLIYGTMPSSDNEIVVDKQTIQNMFDNEDYAKMVGIKNVWEMLNRTVKINYMSDFKIVGIVDKKSPSIYTNRNQFINIIYNSIEENELSLIDYELFKDKIVLKEGRMPSNPYEVIVNINNKEAMPLNKKTDIKVNGEKLIVVGYYYSKENFDYYLVDNMTIKYDLIKQKDNITIFPKNYDDCLEEFRSYNLNIKDSYEYSKQQYLNENKERLNSTILVSIIILVISLIEMFLMMRSSFLSRIKEIGIYRAIGVKKTDIYKMFIGEIFAITSLASIPGLIIMSYILSKISEIKYISGLFLINASTIIISLAIVYAFNLVIGLLPVYNTIRKTPAEILSRNDLD